MRVLRPRLSNKWQATACQISARAPTLSNSTRQFRSLQQVGNKAAYTTQPFSGERFFFNKIFNQASPRGTLSRGHAASGRQAHCARPFLTNNTRDAAESRVSYSTETIAAEEPTIHDLFESKTGTWQYVVADPSTLTAVIVDPVLDYDPATQVVTTQTADSLISLVREKGYKVDRILETHVHADHLTAASYLQNRLAQEQGYRPPIGIGKRIEQVQKLFGQRYGIPAEEYEGTFGKLFDDDETFNIGNLRAMAIHLPGHTPDHLGYKIGDNVFCGDSLFHADIGTARCDFPGGSANNLFDSGRKLLGLSGHTKIWTGHDYPPHGRSAPVPWMSVQDHRAQNKHLKDSVTEEEFVALRKERDSKLAEPKLLHHALQVNIRAGKLPSLTEAGGHRMLHLPLKQKGLEW